MKFAASLEAISLHADMSSAELMTLAAGSSIWGSKIVLYVSMLLAFVGIAAGVWAIVSLFGNPDGELDGVLSSYVNPDGTVVTEEDLLVQSSIVKKAISATETFTEKRGFSEKVADLLERADLPVKTAEALFFGFAGTFIVFGLVFVVSKSLIGALVFGLTAAGIMFFVLQFLARRRLKKFESQLPDTLQLLAGTLRAGYSLPQGMDAVSKEIDDPMGQELARAMSEAQLGRDLEDALAGVADRLDSPDFAWAVMAIAIQREVGGNLNELLMSVAETMTQRDRLKREVSALTAEGRVSAGMLSIMPPALAMVIWIINPGYLDPLFTEWAGRIALGVGIMSALIGLVWMKKVITIDA